MQAVEIINFSEDLAEHIKRLNYAWIEKYFRLEAGDIQSLSNPQTEIVDKGGLIYYARIGQEIVGTVSLLKKSDSVFELAKMAVSEGYQGYKIGTKLMDHCLAVAKELKLQKLILYSNRRLLPALHLYQKYGFVEVELEKGLYDRADIKMEMLL